MSLLHIDFESRSTVDLKKTGVYPYAAHPTTDLWCAQYAFDDEAPELWTPGEPAPERIVDHVRSGASVAAWNSQFERIMWRSILVPRYRWPMPEARQWEDPMVWSMAMGFPAQLAQCAQAMGNEKEKDMAGYRLMLQMAKPRRVNPDGSIVWWDDFDRRQRLYAYCAQDVEAEREIADKLLPLSREEYDFWLLDQEINDRGVKVDRVLVARAREVAERRIAKLDLKLWELTDGRCSSTQNVPQLGAFLVSIGYPMVSMDKDHIAEALNDPKLPPLVRSVLLLRREAGKTSTSKLAAMEAAMGADGRIRGMFQFHGAGTGRFTSRLVQLHNLARPAKVPAHKEFPMDAVCDDMLVGSDDLIEVTWGNPLDMVSSIVRGCLVPAHEHAFAVIDFAQIEARLTAFLAGQWDVVEIFRSGQDVYTYDAKQIGSDERQLGKVVRLALGFQMGVPTFIETAAKAPYFLKLEEEFATRIHTAWRKANKAITTYWRNLHKAAAAAVRDPGSTHEVGHGIGNVKYRVANGHLWCRLPSGRLLCYPNPSVTRKLIKWVDPETGEEKEFYGDDVSYWGVDSLTKKWKRQHGYGGLWCENIIQAVARDLLRDAMKRCEAAGIRIVMHVHDELIAEVKKLIAKAALEQMQQIGAIVPDWLRGCPISSGGYVASRYRKG